MITGLASPIRLLASYSVRFKLALKIALRAPGLLDGTHLVEYCRLFPNFISTLADPEEPHSLAVNLHRIIQNQNESQTCI
jgi:hypothetical protein